MLQVRQKQTTGPNTSHQWSILVKEVVEIMVLKQSKDGVIISTGVLV